MLRAEESDNGGLRRGDAGEAERSEGPEDPRAKCLPRPGPASRGRGADAELRAVRDGRAGEGRETARKETLFVTAFSAVRIDGAKMDKGEPTF